MSLLTIVQDATTEIGVAKPSTVISNTAENEVRLLAMAQREGKQLASKREWQILQREHTFNTVASQEEYALPSDYVTMISDTAWDRDDYENIRRIDAQEWQVYKSGIVGSGVVNRRWRIKRAASGNTKVFCLDPTPTTVAALVFEYRSNGWCASSGGAIQTAWAADDDVGILSEELMTMGVVWRFLRAIGNDYASQLLEYEQAEQRAFAEDLSLDAMTLHRPPNWRFGGYVPDTGFGT